MLLEQRYRLNDGKKCQLSADEAGADGAGADGAGADGAGADGAGAFRAFADAAIMCSPLT